MRYGQVCFHDFDLIFQFLLCESCICSSLFWSIYNSSVLHEFQESRGAHLAVRIVPSSAPHPTLFSCCSLPVDEVSVSCLSEHGPSGEHCRCCVTKYLLQSVALHHNFVFLPSPKMWSFTFYRCFLKGKKLTLIKKWFWKCLQCTPFLPFRWVLTFPSASCLVWSLESCLKMRALIFTTKEFKEYCWERDIAWIWNELLG